ncbi:MAG TPA: alkaline phosphatase family protein [Solirubrobacteraceae bacterium]
MSTGVIPPPARRAGSLPFPNIPAGTPNGQMPFDHLVVVMMENHSFDNLLGALSLTRPEVDGLSFDNTGTAGNWNPGVNHMPAQVHAFPLPNTAQATNITQSWRATHQQVNGGAMDGFVRSCGALEPMGYYTRAVLPFAYALADAFTLANRWFASAPAPTYPNRRFMMAGTAFGGTVTDVSTLLDAPPPHGTIFDVLSSHRINWCDYFTDVPMTAVIPSIVVKHADHHAPIAKFFHDCQAGMLPAVSFVDPGIGVSEIGSQLASLPFPVKEILSVLGASFAGAGTGETEEDPQDMFFGEAFAHRVITAVLQSPRWNRTLVIYTYDEHGGYYDHVPPPRVTPPDNIPPQLAPGDPPGAYDVYGPRVPAIVISPCAKPGGVSNKIYDHTSILATIEHKWNLPALTVRDANANTIMDFLDPGNPALINPPSLPAPPRPPGI